MPASNLSRAMSCFNLSEGMLSKALRLDRAQINRWKHGKRTLKWHSPHTKEIARYLLDIPYATGQETLRNMLTLETNWRGDPNALEGELASWLCRPLDPLDDSGIAQALYDTSELSADDIVWPLEDADMPPGPFAYLPWDAMLRHIVYALRSGASRELRVLIPPGSGTLPVGEHFMDFFRHFMGDDGLHATVLIAPDKRGGDLGALLSQWVPILSKGNIALLATRDMPSTHHIIFALDGQSGIYCLIQPVADAEPCCLYMDDGQQARHILKELDTLLEGAKPLLSMLLDRDLHRLEDIFFDEFKEPGGYDILKSGVNTMFLGPGDFESLLLRKGYEPETASHRTGRFTQFQQTMCGRMAISPVRELLDIGAIEHMLQRGRYQLPGLYFDCLGLMEIDRPTIASICRGYAAFLRDYPLFEVRLSANTPQFLDKLCWHIKSSRHVLLQTWHGTAPLSIYTQHRPLVSEFTRNFEAAWTREPPVSRDAVIAQFEQWGRE